MPTPGPAADGRTQEIAAGAGPKNRGSFPAIVPLNNPWELRAFGLTQHANAGTATYGPGSADSGRRLTHLEQVQRPTDLPWPSDTGGFCGAIMDGIVNGRRAAGDASTANAALVSMERESSGPGSTNASAAWFLRVARRAVACAQRSSQRTGV